MKLSGKELSGSVVKNSPAIQEGDTSSISWTRKWNPLQYSCLGNSMERGACWAAVHGVAKESNTTYRLNNNNNNKLSSREVK